MTFAALLHRTQHWNCFLLIAFAVCRIRSGHADLSIEDRASNFYGTRYEYVHCTSTGTGRVPTRYASKTFCLFIVGAYMRAVRTRGRHSVIKIFLYIRVVSKVDYSLTRSSRQERHAVVQLSMLLVSYIVRPCVQTCHATVTAHSLPT